MREIFRSTDLAEIAMLTSVFKAAGLQLFPFDEYTNAIGGGLLGGFSPCRFMVLDEEYEDACEILKEYGLDLAPSDDDDYPFEIMETTLLAGRVKLLQPKTGFHASIDSVFLAAAVPVKDRHKVLDAGCGVGSVGLCVLSRNKNISLTGIDIQSDLIDLACENADLNGVAERCNFFHGDILTEKAIPDNAFNVVTMNPPYLEGGAHTPSPEKIKAASHGENASGATLEDWVRYAHRKLKQGGTLTMIHRADRMDDVIGALEKKRWFGSLVIYPLWPHAGEDAKRILVQARKERYAPLILKSGMVIHKENGQYTDTARLILSESDTIALT
ncbi:MAG: methyltransferase [Pseudomonadota bacterium]